MAKTRIDESDLVTLGHLYQLLFYNHKTGIFTWRVRVANRLAGTRAGYEDNVRGYRYINIDGRRYYEHRLAWFYMKGVWPRDEIDHKKGKLNKFNNLREATSSNNKMNRRVKSNSESGLKGVTQDKRRGTWSVDVSGHGIRYRKSGFASADAAHAVYREKIIELHGEFARAA